MNDDYVVPWDDRICGICKDVFKPYNSSSKYCSKTCATVGIHKKQIRRLLKKIGKKTQEKGPKHPLALQGVWQAMCQGDKRPSVLWTHVCLGSQQETGKRIHQE